MISSDKLRAWAAYVPPSMYMDEWDSTVSHYMDKRDMAIEILELRKEKQDVVSISNRS